MKVLFISSSLPCGKPSPTITNQAKFNVENGCDVDFFIIINKGFRGYLKEIFLLKKFIKTKRYDIYHAHYGLSAIVATFAGLRPLIVSLMGSDVHEGGWQKWLIKIFVRYRWAATITKSSELAKKTGVNYCTVIPNGVDRASFEPTSLLFAKQSLGLNSNKRYVLFAANPTRSEKNFKLAQMAFKKIKTENVELIKMENIPNKDVPLWMNAADVVALSSLWEGSPNVIKEAMACNRPIVSTNVGDVEWLFGNEPGHFLAGFEVDDYASKLSLALAYAQEHNSTMGRERIEQLGLDSKNIANRIISVYTKVLNEK